MPRTARMAPGGAVFHVLNRANARARTFAKDRDYQTFEQIMAETAERGPLRIPAYCLMPNHEHLVLSPRRDGEPGAFMQHLSTTHTRRYHLQRHSVGSGHVYQGSYKSLPVQVDARFVTVCRYVERNALRARPRNWVAWVNQPQSAQELEGLRLSVQRGRPYGDRAWQKRIAKRLGLESTFRSRGRPRKG